MAHFAKLGVDNIVTKVHVLANHVIADENGQDDEQKGIEFLQNLHKNKDTHIQTSYNTFGGQHSLGGTPLRKNYGSSGYTYDESRDAFIAPQPYPSWLLNDDTCIWDAPTPYPDDGKEYRWDEDNQVWTLLTA